MLGRSQASGISHRMMLGDIVERALLCKTRNQSKFKQSAVHAAEHVQAIAGSKSAKLACIMVEYEWVEH